MPPLKLVYGPDKIFKQKAAAVVGVDETLVQLVDDMVETLYHENGVGLGANMVGVLKRVIVVDLQEGGVRTPQAFINPEIISQSDEMQSFEEASLSFPGISAEISRPEKITISYLDIKGEEQTLSAEGYLATVIQHEMDYLDGVIYLDYLSPLKRNRLLKKMKKLARG